MVKKFSVIVNPGLFQLQCLPVLLDGINIILQMLQSDFGARCSVERFYICAEALMIGNLHLLFDEKRPFLEILVGITGLTSGVNYTYQYWVGRNNSVLIPCIGTARSIFYFGFHLMMIGIPSQVI
jgi:hypothetical protein